MATTRADSLLSTLSVEGRMIFLFLAWQYAVRRLLDSDERINRAITYFVAGSALSSLVAIGQALGGGFAFGELRQGRAVGLSDHPNNAGGSLSVALIMVLMAISLTGAGRRYWRVAVIALLATAMVLSGSVTGMLATVAGFMVLVVRRGISPRNILAALGAVGFVLLGIVAIQSRIPDSGLQNLSPLARLSQTTGGGSTQQNTLATRLETDNIAWRDIRESPIVGRGLDDASSIVLSETGTATHNLFLLAWRGGGILFLSGVVIAAGSALGSRRRFRRDSTHEILVVSACTAIIFAMTAPVLFQRYFWLPFVLLLACRNTDRRMESNREETDATSVFATIPAGRPLKGPTIRVRHQSKKLI